MARGRATAECERVTDQTPPVQTPPDPRLEALRDRYAVERLIGEGGMATVHLAEDLKHGRKVALKVLRPELSLAGDRFLREIRVTAGLQHPGIVPLYDSGNEGGVLYYVMPWIDGESLRERLDREGRIPLEESLRVLQTVASALQYAHDEGVVHRDVKPSNILLGRAGTVQVADFGVAHAVQAAGSQRLTATGHSVGTPTYMSPEQAAGDEEVDGRSDVYALGAMAYEMLSGSPPFTAGNTAALLSKKLTSAPPTLSEVPPAVQRMVRRALETDRAHRQGSAREFAETAVGLLVDSSREPRPPEDGPPSIVVLPFRNLSSDPDTDFFAEGIAEEIISDLAQLDALTVISRTTAMQYRDSALSVPEIARDLGVRYVLEGSVRKAGEAVRVTVQVIEAAADRNLWSSKFSGTMADVFEIQERVAAEVAGALHLSVSDEQAHRMRRRRLEDPRELELFMRVRRELWRADEESLVRAEAMLAAASELVSESPRLMAVKAEILFQSVNLGFSEEKGRFEEARRLAEQAIDADPECAPAYAVLGWIVTATGHIAEGIEFSERAAALDPSDGTALLAIACFGAVLGVTRDMDPGEVAEEMLTSDPLWPPAHIAVWWNAIARGDFDAALDASSAALRLEASPLFALFQTFSLVGAGRIDDAIEASASESGVGGLWTNFIRAMHHGLKADADAARAELTSEVRAWARHDGEYCWHLSQILAIIGDHDEAIEWLGYAVDNQLLNWRMFGEHDPFLAPLRGRDDFQAVIERARRESHRLVMRWGGRPL